MVTQIQIFDEITNETVKAIYDKTKDLAKGSEVELIIASYGGSLLDTVAIIEHLRQFKTHAIIMGFACSAAAILAISCNKVSMGSEASLMIHSAWSEVADDDDPGIKRCNEVQLNIIRRRVHNINNNILKSDTWLSAQQCLALGLIDNINNNEWYNALSKKYAAKIQTIAAKFKGGNPMAEELKVQEVLEEIMEEKMEAEAEAAEEAKVEEVVEAEAENHDLLEVVEKLTEKLNALEERICALEAPVEVVEESKEEEIAAEAENEEQERINAIYKNLARPQARISVGAPKASTNKVVHKVDYKAFASFLND